MIVETTWLHAVLEITAALSPVYAYLFTQVPLSRRFLVPLKVSALALSVFFIFARPFDTTTRYVASGYSLQVTMYPLSLFIFLNLFDWKLGEKRHLGEVLTASILVTYLVSEFHDIPFFVRGYLGMYDEYVLEEMVFWFTPVNHIYLILVTVLAAKIGELRIDWKTFLTIGLGVASLFLIYPFHNSFFNAWIYGRRLISLACLAVTWVRK